MTEGSFPKVDGDILYASEVNNFHNPVLELYTGTGFNSSASNTTDEQSYELTAVTSGISNRDYVKVSITGGASVSYDASSGYVQLKAQIKETGGSYADIVAYQSVIGGSLNAYSGQRARTYTYEVIYALTAGMKANGFQIKVFSKSNTNNAGTSASFTNSQTVVELA